MNCSFSDITDLIAFIFITDGQSVGFLFVYRLKLLKKYIRVGRLSSYVPKRLNQV